MATTDAGKMPADLNVDLVAILRAHQDINDSLDSGVAGHGDFRMSLLGVVSEIGEVLAELPWRPWRAADQRDPTPEELEAVLPELADAAGALFRTVVNLGITPEDFAMACREHVEEKWRRISAGVDR